MAFFDKAENTSGSLTARLGVDTASIRGAVGDQVGVLVQNLTTFIAAYIIAFSSGWKMTLVITAMLPLLIFATFTESKLMQGFANEVGLRSWQVSASRGELGMPCECIALGWQEPNHNDMSSIEAWPADICIPGRHTC